MQSGSGGRIGKRLLPSPTAFRTLQCVHLHTPEKRIRFVQRNTCMKHEDTSQSLDQQMNFLRGGEQRSELARRSYDLALDCRDVGKLQLAESNLRRVLLLFQDAHPTNSKESLANFSLVAACCNHLGLLCLDSGRPDQGIPHFDRAINIRRELQRIFPEDRANQVYLGGSLCNRAHSVADTDATSAVGYYQQSLAILRQPTQPCECSYWDEQRQSWWCEQLEALGQSMSLPWVALAPRFIDNAMQGLASTSPSDSV